MWSISAVSESVTASARAYSAVLNPRRRWSNSSKRSSGVRLFNEKSQASNAKDIFAFRRCDGRVGPQAHASVSFFVAPNSHVLIPFGLHGRSPAESRGEGMRNPALPRATAFSVFIPALGLSNAPQPREFGRRGEKP